MGNHRVQSSDIGGAENHGQKRRARLRSCIYKCKCAFGKWIIKTEKSKKSSGTI
jgi:hypothetical protein